MVYIDMTSQHILLSKLKSCQFVSDLNSGWEFNVLYTTFHLFLDIVMDLLLAFDDPIMDILVSDLMYCTYFPGFWKLFHKVMPAVITPNNKNCVNGNKCSTEVVHHVITK